MKLFGSIVAALLLVGNLMAIPPQAPKPPQAPAVKAGCYCHDGGDCVCVSGCPCPQCSCFTCPGDVWLPHSPNWNYHAKSGWYANYKDGWHYHKVKGWWHKDQQMQQAYKYQQPVQMLSFSGFGGGYGGVCAGGG